MGIYYAAIDWNAKEIIHVPQKYSCKMPGLCDPNNPFPGVVVMKNCYGSFFNIVNDCSNAEEMYSGTYKNVTKESFKKYFELHGIEFTEEDLNE